MSPRDDHAADIAGLKAQVERLDEGAAREHEYLESVSHKGQETARTVQEIEVAQAKLGEQVDQLGEEQRKGSERMKTIEAKQGATDRKLAWYAGALTAGAFLAPILGDLVRRLLGWA